jgi:hypothetical protein
MACDETSTAGVPASNVDYIRCDATSHTIELSDNNGAESPIATQAYAQGVNTTGTAANLSGTPALPNGTTATTQSAGANDTKLATDAYVNVAYNSIAASGCTTGTHCTLTGKSGFYWCNTGAECYYTLDAPVAGKQYCFGDYAGQTNVLSITSTTSVYIVYKGTNGTVTTGTLVSNGAAGDFTCMEGVDTTHYMVTGAGYGTWTNN